MQGGVGKHSGKLQLRVLLHRHQVQDTDLQGTDILVHGPVFIHHKNIFIFQYLLRRQIALYFDRHIFCSISLC